MIVDSGASMSITTGCTLNKLIRDPEFIQTADGKTKLVEYKTTMNVLGNEIPALVIPEGENLVSLKQLTDLGFMAWYYESKLVIIQPKDISEELKHTFRKLLYQESNIISDTEIDRNENQDFGHVINLIMSVEGHEHDCSDGYQLLPPSEWDCLKLFVAKKLKQFRFCMPENPSKGYNIHCKLGHMRKRDIKKVYGIKLTKGEEDEIDNCLICAYHKFRRKTRIPKTHGPNTKEVFAQVHFDMFHTTHERGWKRYVSVIIDDYSRYVWVLSHQRKAGLKHKVMKLLEEQSKLQNRTPSLLVSDRGTENFFGPDDKYVRRFAPTGEKEFNGLAERYVQSIKTRIELITSHLSEKSLELYYDRAVEHAGLSLNIQYNSTIQGVPLQRFYGSVFNFIDPDELPMFLEDCVVTFNQNNKEERIVAVFGGYDPVRRIYKMLDLREYPPKEVEVSSRCFQSLSTFGLHLVWEFDFETREELMKSLGNGFTMLPALFKTKLRELYYEGIKLPHKAQSVQQVGKIPKNIKEAMKDKIWMEAIDVERDAFIANEVYAEYEGQPGEDVTKVASWWIFTLKYNQYTKSHTPKARMLHVNWAEVNTKSGETAPVGEKSSLMMMFCLLSIGGVLGYKFASVDIKTAFLTAPINILPKFKDRKYITKTSAAFKHLFKTEWVELKKSCYGLNIAPANFYAKLKEIIVDKLGYEQTMGDECLFYHKEHGLIMSHVDDLAILSKHPKEVVKAISTHFVTKASYTPELYVGYQITFTGEYLQLGNEDYVTQVVEQLFDEETLKFIKSPTKRPGTEHFGYLAGPPDGEPSHVTQEYVNSLEEQKNANLKKRNWIYIEPPNGKFTVLDAQRLMGILTYLTSTTRIDVEYHTGVLSRYNQYPTRLSYLCIIHLFRFIYSTKTFKIQYGSGTALTTPTPSLHIEILSDASFQKLNNSYLGYHIQINKQYWTSKSRRIKIQANSSYLVELVAAHAALEFVAKHHSIISRAREILNDCEVQYDLYVDNQSLIHSILSDAQGFTKQAEPYCHKLLQIREWVRSYNIRVQHVSGKENIPDIYTKNVTPSVLDYIFAHTDLSTQTNVITEGVMLGENAWEKKEQEILNRIKTQHKSSKP